MLRTSAAVSRPGADAAGPPAVAKCSYAMSFYVFRAAQRTGVYDRLWPELVAPWHAMLTDNLATFAESESMPRSDCHGWSAGPIYETVAEVFGVQPMLDSSLVVRPRLALLRGKAVSARIVTPKGLLTVRCDDAGRVFLEAEFDGVVCYGDSKKSVTLEKAKAVCVDECSS